MPIPHSDPSETPDRTDTCGTEDGGGSGLAERSALWSGHAGGSQDPSLKARSLAVVLEAAVEKVWRRGQAACLQRRRSRSHFSAEKRRRRVMNQTAGYCSAQPRPLRRRLSAACPAASGLTAEVGGEPAAARNAAACDGGSDGLAEQLLHDELRALALRLESGRFAAACDAQTPVAGM